MVVKCDIEGGELAVVTDMVVTGAMEVVDNLHIVTIITIIIIIMEVVDNLHIVTIITITIIIMEVVDNLHIVTIITIIIIMEVVDNLHMEWHGVQGPGFLRTGEEAEMIDKLAQAVS